MNIIFLYFYILIFFPMIMQTHVQWLLSESININSQSSLMFVQSLSYVLKTLFFLTISFQILNSSFGVKTKSYSKTLVILKLFQEGTIYHNKEFLIEIFHSLSRLPQHGSSGRARIFKTRSFSPQTKTEWSQPLGL